jgi:hypothetical protein
MYCKHQDYSLKTMPLRQKGFPNKFAGTQKTYERGSCLSLQLIRQTWVSGIYNVFQLYFQGNHSCRLFQTEDNEPPITANPESKLNESAAVISPCL